MDLDKAYSWLCNQRKKYSHNSDIWDLRFHWDQKKVQIQNELQFGTYRFKPLTLYRFKEKAILVWSAEDSLVLKAMAEFLKPLIKKTVSTRCTHLKGNGGLKKTIQRVYHALPHYKHFVRCDVKSFYSSIDHELLLGMLKKLIHDPILLNLLDKATNFL